MVPVLFLPGDWTGRGVWVELLPGLGMVLLDEVELLDVTGLLPRKQ